MNVFLGDIYTLVERTLIDAGHEAGVRQTRHLFQLAMAARFTGLVETITERKVITFMSQVHSDPDMAAEIFVLDPTPAERAAT